MDIDRLSHSNTLHDQIMESLNQKSLCKYDSLHKAYVFQQSAILVNCSHILIFLKHLHCYTVNPDTHQWYRINSHKIQENHNVAICNDKTVNTIQLPPAEPPEANAIETFARLTTINSNTNVDQISNNTNGNPPLNSIPLPDNQSSIIIDQFSQLKEELKIFFQTCLKQPIRNAQAHRTTQEQTGKFIENAIFTGIN